MSNDLIFLKHFSTVSEAELGRNILESNGIKSILQRGNQGAAARFSGWAGDANLFVLKKDHNQAKDILEVENKEN